MSYVTFKENSEIQSNMSYVTFKENSEIQSSISYVTFKHVLCDLPREQ
jgi:hypothetical protein